MAIQMDTLEPHKGNIHFLPRVDQNSPQSQAGLNLDKTYMVLPVLLLLDHQKFLIHPFISYSILVKM